MLIGVAADVRGVAVSAAHLGEVAAQPVQAAAGGVHVRVLEAGQQHPAAQVDHAGAAGDQVAQLGVGADGENAVSADGYRPGPAPRGVDPVDRAAPQQHVG